MSYDKDLRVARVAFWVLGAVNIANMLVNGWKHDWVLAFSCFVFALFCSVMAKSTASQQRTRDEVRVAAAGIRAMIEDCEEL